VASARPPAGGAARSSGHGLQVGLRARELCRAILDGFKQHDLLTYSSAISFQIITAVVPFPMFVLALAGLLHLDGVWRDHVAPAIRTHVSTAVFSVISSAVNKAFSDRALLWATFDPASRTLAADHWPAAADTRPEAVLYAALSRGIRDYIDKNGFPGVLLGLSGGIDSALTLALAVDALGADRVTAVMLPTRYTSKLSLEGAREQAERLGVAYHVIDIEPTCQSFLAALTPAFVGKAADTTEENLQSRTRGVMLMALSNKHSHLLLATGNKSEMAVGYATLYGDMCGAYAPLKDVYKTVVYRLSRWRNEIGRVIPPAVIDRPPSAELREDQTDQDSLPPYDVLDAILKRFIEDEQSQAEIAAAGFDPDTVRRVASLVLRNEFKRRQAAPGPRVTTRAFGRERRYPITSGWK
jgi:NAD+ synthase (glutamine-hydrolysing)